MDLLQRPRDEKINHGVEMHWLFAKEKVLGAVVNKEYHTDSLLEPEKIHYKWSPGNKCNCKQCFILPFPLTNFPLFIEGSFIYIYIYCHSQTDCFVVSAFFGVSRLARCFKQRSKPGWFYVSCISYPRAIDIPSVSEGIFCGFLFHIYIIGHWRVQFMRKVKGFIFSVSRQIPHSISHPWWEDHVYFHLQTVLFYLNSSVRQDPQDSSSRYQNPPNVLSVGYLTPKPSIFSRRNFLRISFLHIRYR